MKEFVRCATCGTLVSEERLLRDRSCRRCGDNKIRRYFKSISLWERLGIILRVIR